MPESPICAPVATGGPSSKPVVLIAPPMAWAMFSYALAFCERARAEALERGVDEPRVDLLDALPGEAQPVDHAGAEVLHQDVGAAAAAR